MKLPEFIKLLLAIILIPAADLQAQEKKSDLRDNTCIRAGLPFSFSAVNYTATGSKVPPLPAEKINKLLNEFYNDNIDEEAVAYVRMQDVYFNTVCIPYRSFQLYILIMKTPVNALAQCRVFFYDPLEKKCSRRAVSYNIWAQYTVDGDKLIPSNLTTDAKYDADIVDEQGLLRFTRIYHNGTFTSVDKTYYRLKGLDIDSVSTKSEILR